MNRQAARGFFAVLLVVCAAGGVAAQSLGTGQDPLAGSRVFGAKGCARCHAVGGVGGTVGPDLGRMARPQSLYDLAAALWNHAPRMADRMRELGIMRPQLDDRESADLVGFLFSVSYFEPKGDAELGRRLFAAKACVACHQVRGAGGVLGPPLDGAERPATPIALAASMWNHGPQMADVMRARHIARPTFTGAELRALMAYVGGANVTINDEPLYLLPGNPDAGRRLFAEKLCSTCHGIAGQGAKAAPDLAERLRSPAEFAAAMWNKAPAMTAAMKSAGVRVPKLQPSEMADIVGYLMAARASAQGGEARRGAAVAKAKGCVGCHRPDLSDTQGATTFGGALAALWNHSFLGDKRPAARAPWAPMSGDDMADLIAFLQASRSAR